jgi:hypothetical protein
MVILVVVLVLAYVAFGAAVGALLRRRGRREDATDLTEAERNRLASLDRARSNQHPSRHFKHNDE